MAKAGDEYRELVGNVLRALEPGATVKTEQWIEGPDGNRDMDVELRGTRDGCPHFVLIECKDHRKPIGIGYVDAFESKCRDLKPDRRIIFSNSGFTEDALKKATRVRIELASAMKAMDDAIHVRIEHKVIARRLTLRFATSALYPYEGEKFDFEEAWQLAELTFDGLPVTHWISAKMKLLAVEHNEAKRFTFACALRHEPRWAYRGARINIGGLSFWFTSAKDWVSQVVRTDASLGYFAHVCGKIIVPPRETYLIGMIDRNQWKETDDRWELKELEPSSFRLDFTITQSNLPNSPSEPPAIDELIIQQHVEFE